MIPALIITGPTAVGKSPLALELAREYHTEIISADSVQVYKYLDIGSAKVDFKTRQEIPHHLIDIVEPDEDFDAGAYLKQAEGIIENFIKAKKQILIVGGTGLYLKALTNGLISLPDKDMEIRRELHQLIDKGGGGELFQRLKTVDPVYAQKIHPHDYQRLVRALEVFTLTGKPFSDFHKKTPKPFPQLQFIHFCLTREKEDLHARIAERVEEMFHQGLVAEVEGLLENYSPRLKSMQSLGYRQAIQHLQGELTLEQAKQEIIKQTKLFAKRQLTWCRKNKEIHWLNLSATSPAAALEQIKETIEKRQR